MPGALNLAASEALAAVINAYQQADKYLAAVCAAPMVYGQMGLLEGREAICYPGFEDKLTGAQIVKKSVVQDGHFITGCGAGAGFALGAKMVEALVGRSTADAVLRQMMFGVYSD
jgi:4-methyl-5(b-hydroxyethyl)-thiazole monophosphate biosynthesis